MLKHLKVRVDSFFGRISGDFVKYYSKESMSPVDRTILVERWGAKFLEIVESRRRVYYRWMCSK